MTNRHEKSGKDVRVFKIFTEEDIKSAHKIRYEVFVIGQSVPVKDEIDEFEDASFHFLAKIEGKIPCGAARWRITDNGVKLERFSVLEKYRGMGIGTALVDAILKDVDSNPEAKNKPLYLYAQLGAIKLYSNFGFERVGEMFQECNIDHYTMVKK